MSWRHVSLGEVCTFMTGGTPKSSELAYYKGGTVPWIVSGDIHQSEIFACEKRITELGLENSNAKYLPNNSVLIALNGQGKTRGTVALLRTEGATCNQSIVSINPADQEPLNSEFLFQYLRSQYKQIRGITGDKDRAGLNIPLLKAIEIPLPPLPEQKRIAAILDKADAIRRKRQKAINLAEKLLRSVFLDMYGDPIRNPKGWDVLKMGDVINFKGGSQPPKNTFIHEPREGYTRLIQIRDFKSDKYPSYIPDDLARRRFEKNDVMIARYGPPVFQILRGLEGSYNVALMKAEPKADIREDFIYYLLQLPAYHGRVVAASERTAGQTGVNLDLLNDFDVPLPSKDSQDKIISRLVGIENLVKVKKNSQNCSNQFFDALTQKAFAGEL